MGTTLHQFKSYQSSCNFVDSTGRIAHFVSGRFTTNDPLFIKELTEQVELGHPVFYIDENEKTIDSDLLDPLEYIRRKAVADYLAQQASRVGTDFGTTENAPNAGILTTAELTQEAAAGLTAPAAPKTPTIDMAKIAAAGKK